MKKIKVTHVINNLQIGGAENFLILLLGELSKYKDLDLELISLEGKGVLEEKVKNLPISYKRFKFHIFLPIIRRIDPGFRIGFLLHLIKKRPDIIHGHLRKGEDFSKLAAGILNIKSVTTNHDVMTFPGRKEKLLNRFLNRAVAVSDVVKGHLISAYLLPEKKIEVIPDGIEIEKFRNSKRIFDKNKPVFIYVGRIAEGKGLEYAVKALGKLKKEYLGLKFLIYGKEMFPSDKEKLENIISKNNWNFIHFMGQTEDVPSALARGDIFLYPTKSEGFGMSVLEAATAGKPIIATAVGTIPSLIKDGENGYFIKYGDVSSIYRKAKKILESGEIEKMGQKSTQIASKHFSIEKVAKMYYSLYLELIDG